MTSYPASTGVVTVKDPRPALARVFLGARADPLWARPALWGLLALTAALYLWDLTASGFANTFYAAAVQAGASDWKAWFFGSLDASNFITVDKPPASLWVMGLSARLFGFSSASLLVPQALMGVASVALTYGAVRRTLVRFGRRASLTGALLAGFVLAFTPAAALMFRFDNPDALLVLLMTGAAYAVVRALPRASWRWLALAGALLGFAFLTKMLQGLTVLPAFALVYLIAAPARLRTRLVHLAIAAGALVVAAGWWVLAVALWPADARPYIGGSTNNSVLDLVFGYNGFGRLFGGSGNGGGGGGNSGSSFGGSTGLQRLFSSEMGLEISWLLPAAILALVLGLIAVGRSSRLDLARSGLVTWGGWLVVTGLVFSYMSGTIHPYYTVALAPAIAGLVGTGGVILWLHRGEWLGRFGLALMIGVSGIWGFSLLSGDTTFLPWLRWVVLVGAMLSAFAVIVGTVARLRTLTVAALIAGSLFGLGGTTAYSIATAATAHSGSIPSAVSTSQSGMGAGGGATGGTPPTGTAPGGSTTGGSTASGSATSGSATPGSTGSGSTASGSATSGSATSGSTATSGTGTATGGPGGTTSSAALTKLLKASTARWAAATNGSQSAATLELASGTSVMAIGGWSSDPAPTLAQFKAFVAAGDIGYYIASGSGGQGGAGGGTSTASAIQSWVEAHFTATTVGGQTVYDLSD